MSDMNTEIDRTYEGLCNNKDECTKALETERKMIMEKLQKGKISEFHFQILNRKIYDYKNKLVS